MHKIRVYVDTSVFGGTQDEEFSEASVRFFERVGEGDYIVLVSGITYAELEDSPSKIKSVAEDLREGTWEEVRVDDEVRALAEEYIAAEVLDANSVYDALHVAAATVAEADLILSWNFRHIVNYDRIRKFNAVNLLKGYRTIDIRSPEEVRYGDQDEDL